MVPLTEHFSGADLHALLTTAHIIAMQQAIGSHNLYAELLQEQGPVAGQIGEREHTILQLREQGNAAHELREQRNATDELREHSNATDELREQGNATDELREHGNATDELIEQVNATDELREQGYVAHELRKQGNAAHELRKQGNTVHELREQRNAADKFCNLVQDDARSGWDDGCRIAFVDAGDGISKEISCIGGNEEKKNLFQSSSNDVEKENTKIVTKSKPQLLQLIVEEERVASSSDRPCSHVKNIPIENEEKVELVGRRLGAGTERVVIELAHVLSALREVRPSVSEQDRRKYERLRLLMTRRSSADARSTAGYRATLA